MDRQKNRQIQKQIGKCIDRYKGLVEDKMKCVYICHCVKKKLDR